MTWLARATFAVAAAGYILVAVTNIITVLPPEALALAQIINYGTILMLCAGLTLVWASSLASRLRGRSLASPPRKKSTQ